jgi:aldose 1-epimerase
MPNTPARRHPLTAFSLTIVVGALACSSNDRPPPADDGDNLDLTDLVNGFAGWSGTAEVVWPERGAHLRIEAGPPLSHLVVYTPPGQDFFCVEPVSHSVDAFNLEARGAAPDNGTTVLAPGGTMTGSARFTVG